MFRARFAKTAVSLGLANRLATSGAAKRMHALAKHHGESAVATTTGRLMDAGSEMAKDYMEHATVKDKLLGTKSDAHFKDLSKKTRALLRAQTKRLSSILPKVK